MPSNLDPDTLARKNWALEKGIVRLVLTRQIGQQIVIGDVIQVTVLECNGGRSRLGVEAPESVLVLRGELQNEGQTLRAEETLASGVTNAGGWSQSGSRSGDPDRQGGDS